MHDQNDRRAGSGSGGGNVGKIAGKRISGPLFLIMIKKVGPSWKNSVCSLKIYNRM